jgi:hypothetical protein
MMMMMTITMKRIDYESRTISPPGGAGVVALMFAKRIANSFARHLKNEKR